MDRKGVGHRGEGRTGDIAVIVGHARPLVQLVVELEAVGGRRVRGQFLQGPF
jgi:hypothetical protein